MADDASDVFYSGSEDDPSDDEAIDLNMSGAAPAVPSPAPEPQMLRRQPAPADPPSPALPQTPPKPQARTQRRDSPPAPAGQQPDSASSGRGSEAPPAPAKSAPKPAQRTPKPTPKPAADAVTPSKPARPSIPAPSPPPKPPAAASTEPPAGDSLGGGSGRRSATRAAAEPAGKPASKPASKPVATAPKVAPSPKAGGKKSGESAAVPAPLPPAPPARRSAAAAALPSPLTPPPPPVRSARAAASPARRKPLSRTSSPGGRPVESPVATRLAMDAKTPPSVRRRAAASPVLGKAGSRRPQSPRPASAPLRARSSPTWRTGAPLPPTGSELRGRHRPTSPGGVVPPPAPEHQYSPRYAPSPASDAMGTPGGWNRGPSQQQQDDMQPLAVAALALALANSQSPMRPAASPSPSPNRFSLPPGLGRALQNASVAKLVREDDETLSRDQLELVCLQRFITLQKETLSDLEVKLMDAERRMEERERECAKRESHAERKRRDVEDRLLALVRNRRKLEELLAALPRDDSASPPADSDEEFDSSAPASSPAASAASPVPTPAAAAPDSPATPATPPAPEKTASAEKVEPSTADFGVQVGVTFTEVEELERGREEETSRTLKRLSDTEAQLVGAKLEVVQVSTELKAQSAAADKLRKDARDARARAADLQQQMRESEERGQQLTAEVARVRAEVAELQRVLSREQESASLWRTFLRQSSGPAARVVKYHESSDACAERWLSIDWRLVLSKTGPSASGEHAKAAKTFPVSGLSDVARGVGVAAFKKHQKADGEGQVRGLRKGDQVPASSCVTLTVSGTAVSLALPATDRGAELLGFLEAVARANRAPPPPRAASDGRAGRPASPLAASAEGRLAPPRAASTDGGAAGPAPPHPRGKQPVGAAGPAQRR
eukprot:TRINITY_DN11893_c0_g1_i2.p1 TRINITY_DN11893_c0_g1~~TRINITY_DN11893_c0_g1_i2.p1  ORF type:complete len:899 (+),score=263.71 TRINITY_DN11893_c0_g1_i2:79-2775(+)